MASKSLAIPVVQYFWPPACGWLKRDDGFQISFKHALVSRVFLLRLTFGWLIRDGNLTKKLRSRLSNQVGEIFPKKKWVPGM